MLKPDKIKHLKGGALAALGCGALGLALLALGAHPMVAVLAVIGLAAGGAIEGMQWMENRAGMLVREVSGWDFLATAAPAWITAAALQAWVAFS